MADDRLFDLEIICPDRIFYEGRVTTVSYTHLCRPSASLAAVHHWICTDRGSICRRGKQKKTVIETI